VCALGLPDAEMPADAASQCAAVRLFVDRAAAVRHGFSLSDEDVTVVGDICRRLDGLPLAIELAAAKAGLVPLAGIRDGLEHRLTLLKGGARDLPARQRTLRAEIGWSHALLDDREKLLFRRLSVFAGGCTLEGAERICRFHGGPTGDEVRDGLLSLANKNLVTISTKDGELRYSFLQTIREYAVERLEESGESEDVRGRFVEACRRHGGTGRAGTVRPDQQRWFERLDGEYPTCLKRLRGPRTSAWRRKGCGLPGRWDGTGSGGRVSPKGSGGSSGRWPQGRRASRL